MERVGTSLTQKGAVFEGGAGFDISQFFLSALLKVKSEHVTREAIRQEVKPRVSELVDIINDMTADIFAQQGRPVLLVIEDLDKPPLSILRQRKQVRYSSRLGPHTG